MNEEVKKEPRMLPFLKGDGYPFIAKHFNRNELCPCGSGKKVKHCHKLETKYYSTKPKPKAEVAL